MNDNDDIGYRVGYGMPPLHSRWKKGVSGNPKGRPPKQERSLTDRQLRRDFLNYAESPTTLRTSKGKRHVTLIEAVIAQQFQKALSGHAPSQRFVIRFYERLLKEHYEANRSVFGHLEKLERQVQTMNPFDDDVDFIYFMLLEQRRKTRKL